MIKDISGNQKNRGNQQDKSTNDAYGKTRNEDIHLGYSFPEHGKRDVYEKIQGNEWSRHEGAYDEDGRRLPNKTQGWVSLQEKGSDGQ